MANAEYLEKQGFKVRAELRLKNAKLVKARETLNLTLEEAASKIGVSYGTLFRFENLKLYPSKESQEKICEFYRRQGVFLLEEDVFPEKLKEFKGKKYVNEKSIPPEKLLPLADLEHKLLTEEGVEWIEEEMTIEEEITAKKVKSKIEAFLGVLTPESELCVRLRYGIDDGEGMVDKVRADYGVEEGKLMKLEDLGEYFGVNKENIKIYLAKAEVKLKKMGFNKEFLELIGVNTK